uniref:Uncharacterized protein n=1 Tax=Sphaerodactylus townsendi TaxID=933632 RepID=A0ACB8ERD8_9SAUR
MDICKEAQTGQESIESQDGVNDVQDLKQHRNKLKEEAATNLSKAQHLKRKCRDSNSQHRIFQAEDEVLVLRPRPKWKLEVVWGGLSIIKEKVSEMHCLVAVCFDGEHIHIYGRNIHMYGKKLKPYHNRGNVVKKVTGAKPRACDFTDKSFCSDKGTPVLSCLLG